MSMETPPRKEPTSKQEVAIWEYAPTRAEILSELKKFCKNPKVEQEIIDEQGIHSLLEVTGVDEQGKTFLCTFQRGGDFGRNTSATMRIYSFYPDTCWGEDLAEYDLTTRQWVQKERYVASPVQSIEGK